MTAGVAQQRYDRSPKGLLRYARYNASAKGSARSQRYRDRQVAMGLCRSGTRGRSAGGSSSNYCYSCLLAADLRYTKRRAEEAMARVRAGIPRFREVSAR